MARMAPHDQVELILVGSKLRSIACRHVCQQRARITHAARDAGDYRRIETGQWPG